MAEFNFLTPNVGPRSFALDYQGLAAATERMENSRSAALGVLAQFLHGRAADRDRRHDMAAQQAHERSMLTLRGALEQQGIRERARAESARIRTRAVAEQQIADRQTAMARHAEAVFAQGRDQGTLVVDQRFSRKDLSPFADISNEGLEAHISGLGTRKPETASALAQYLQGQATERVLNPQAVAQMRQGLLQQGVPVEIVDDAQLAMLGSFRTPEEMREEIKTQVRQRVGDEFTQFQLREDITSPTGQALSGVPDGRYTLNPSFLEGAGVDLDQALGQLDPGRSGVVQSELEQGFFGFEFQRDGAGQVTGVILQPRPGANPSTTQMLQELLRNREVVEGLMVSAANPGGVEDFGRMRREMSERGMFNFLGQDVPINVTDPLRPPAPDQGPAQPAQQQPFSAPTSPFDALLEFIPQTP